MRRLLTLAAFLLVLSLIPVSAQRGGGVRGGFGGRGGTVGHTFGGHSFGGMRSGTGFRFGGGDFSGRRFHNHHRCFGCRARFGFPEFAGIGFWGYDPFWWSDSHSAYDYDREREQEIQLANQMNALNIQEQNLREREDWLREREDQDAYARQPQPRNETPAKPDPATVLVFRDQHRQEITNYAIAGGTLWVLNDHLATRKIPLADLDLVATAKVNDERGVEFQVPK